MSCMLIKRTDQSKCATGIFEPFEKKQKPLTVAANELAVNRIIAECCARIQREDVAANKSEKTNRQNKEESNQNRQDVRCIESK